MNGFLSSPAFLAYYTQVEIFLDVKNRHNFLLRIKFVIFFI